MNWFWIGMAATVPAMVAVVVALPFWLNGAPLGGNLVGAGLIFTAAIASVMREQSDVQQLLLHCVDRGKPCLVHPSPFVRFAVYGCISMVQVAALFVVGLWVEERARRRSFSREWR